MPDVLNQMYLKWLKVEKDKSQRGNTSVFLSYFSFYDVKQVRTRRTRCPFIFRLRTKTGLTLERRPCEEHVKVKSRHKYSIIGSELVSDFYRNEIRR